MSSRHRRLWMLAAILLSPLVVLAADTATTAPADVTTADPQARTITFHVPGSRPDAVSRAVVVLPKSYLGSRGEVVSDAPDAPRTRYSVVYLLHGYGASHTRWYLRMKESPRPLSWYADRFDVLLVSPDARPDSWYLDAAEELKDSSDYQIETLITRHLIPAVDRTFRTWAEPAGRGLTGMSMGGHGAVYLAARHPDVFAACGSMSGVLDLRDSMNKAPLAARIGPIESRPDRWIEHSCLIQAEKFAGRSTGILIDCGWDDPFFANNRVLHDKLMRLKVAHDYIERPGKHDWDYWINALPYHLQFLSDRLKKPGK